MKQGQAIRSTFIRGLVAAGEWQALEFFKDASGDRVLWFRIERHVRTGRVRKIRQWPSGNVAQAASEQVPVRVHAKDYRCLLKPWLVAWPNPSGDYDHYV